MRLFLSVILLLSAFQASLPSFAQTQKKKHLYYANDTHTDVMWNGDEESYEKLVLEHTDFYFKLNKGFGNRPYPEQNKWNFDCAYWLWVLERKTTPAYFQSVIDQYKKGWFSVPYNFLLPTYGATPAEAVLRGMYYAGYLERKYGIKIEMAVCQENATIPLGVASLWRGTGAKYSWKGVCNCATKTLSRGRRPHEIYWYTGLDSSQVMMKWYSNMLGYSGDIGGYSEALEARWAIEKLDTMCYKPHYPYHIAGAFGKGWDNKINMTLDIPYAVKDMSNDKRQVIVSNEVDFFHDFEENYGKVLPKQSVSYGNEWDFLPSSLASVSTRMRRAVEKMRVAEAMASVVAAREPDTFKNLDSLREKSTLALSMYWLHGWTADGPISRDALAAWGKARVADVERYVDTLYGQSLQWLGSHVKGNAAKKRFLVFNALNWQRTDVADVEYSGPQNIAVLGENSKKPVPFQFVQKDGKTYIRLLAERIPSVGYASFVIDENKPQLANAAKAAVLKDGRFENDFYTLAVTPTGVITSLFDKRQQKEFAREVSGKFINDFGMAATGQMRVENDGPVSTTLLCQANDSLRHETRITLYKHLPRIDIQNRVQKNFGHTVATAFSFNLDKPDTWHEEIGAVIKAKRQASGGHYANTFARYDWLSLQHFANVSSGNASVTLSNGDGSFMRLGNSTPESLDENSSQLNVLLGGQMDKDKNLGIFKQHGDSLFLQHFALQTHAAAFDAKTAMKFALEHQTPLAAGFASGGNALPPSYSFLKTDNDNVVLWALKPAEEGAAKEGIVARFYNLQGSTQPLVLSGGQPLAAAKQCSHVETDIQPAKTEGGKLKTSIGFHQMKTWKLFFKK
ncbi:MAG: glycosyl hydrolase-related protein [Cytophagales bacterium]|nr:glycosyl hydrolase-related protein [Cytophagales bacterium]